MRLYNVPNDRALAPSTGGVEYKEAAGCWISPVLAAGIAPEGRSTRGRMQWSALTAVCIAAAALAASHSYHMFRIDVEHRLTPCRHVR